ncbi:TonB-dependent receptor [Prevotella aurantiaca]|jgi:tonB-dependent receptor|uniref:TonB-dependent receptor n=1 Tax=Prevotella aurantiaca TaxID=596085 RepID=UPI0023F0B39C
MNKILFTILFFSLLPISLLADNNDEISDTARIYDIDGVFIYDNPKEAYLLRQQPLNSTSFNQLQLRNLNTQDLRQLSSFVPSFVMPEYGARYTSSIYMRGIGSRINSPAVGMYIDNMPIQSKSAFNFHTYDIDRIDVLHGPQGTLYGMNTEGGLIRLYSKNPFVYQGTDLKLSLGNNFWRKAEISHYKRMNDKTAFAVSAFYDGQNGFFTNKYTGKRADKFNEFGGKTRLLWNPNERLDLSFVADYQFVNQYGFPYGQVVTREQVVTTDITSPYYTLKAGTQAPSQNRQSAYKRNMLNTGIGLKYNGNSFVINSMTSWQYLRDRLKMDNDYLPNDFLYLEQYQLQNSITEELSVKSKSQSRWQWAFGAYGSYQWLKTEAPVYFGGDMNKALSQQITAYAYNGMLAVMTKRIAADLIKKGMSEEKAMEVAAISAKVAIEKAGGIRISMQMDPIFEMFRTPIFNMGLYHESNIDITDRLRATLGLRYDYSHVAIDYNTSARLMLDESVMGINIRPTITSTLAHNEKNHFKELLPKIGLTYRFNNGSNAYATWSKGYRAGGFNIQMFSDILQTELSAASQGARGDVDVEHDNDFYKNIAKTIEYKPETSFNYEVGAHLNLIDEEMTLDVAAYYMQIKNQQLSVLANNYGFGRMMTNAGKSHSCGLEATLRGETLNKKLNYALSYGFTSTKFDEYTETTSGTIVDYKGKRVPFVPQHTLAANADYRIDVDPAALLDPSNKFHLCSVIVGLNLSAQGNTYWDEQNSIAQNFYVTLGAHADADFGPMHINLWVRNLTDTKYNTFAVQSAATGNRYIFGQLGNPFQIGVDVSFHF